MTPPAKQPTRELRRLRTRERILGAAIAEFTSSGMTHADIDVIATAAGVAHGTFFFHFPSKEHVLLELEACEEARMATRFGRYLEGTHTLASILDHVVQLITGLERRLGPSLFKVILALHFSPTRPGADESTDHPLIVLLVREIERARGDEKVPPEVDAFYSATFFLLGIYGVLTTTSNADSRDHMLTGLVTTALRGLEAR